MKYYSEVTKKLYNSETELMEEERKVKAKDDEKSKRKSEVDKAWEKVDALQDKLDEAANYAQKLEKKYNEDFKKNNEFSEDEFAYFLKDLFNI